MRFHVLNLIVGSVAETTYEPIAPRYGEAPRCPKCGLNVGMRAWLPPYRVRMQVFGNRVGDIAFGAGNDLLLSDAFLDGWCRAGLRGLGETQSVEIERIQPRCPAQGLPRFHHVVVQRERASIDPGRTRVVRTGMQTCDFCGGGGIVNAILGIGISENSWNGADLFMPWGLSGIIVVTERVVTLASKYGLANVTTIPVEKYQWNPLGKEENRMG